MNNIGDDNDAVKMKFIFFKSFFLMSRQMLSALSSLDESDEESIIASSDSNSSVC